MTTRDISARQKARQRFLELMQETRDREPERQAELALIRAMYDQSSADLVRMGLPPRLNPLRDQNGDPFPPVDPAA